jgi:PAS domain S-box-containing protein
MTDPHPPDDPLAVVSDGLRGALDAIDLPAYVIDRDGTLRWANQATSVLIGDRIGQSFLNFLPADVRERVKAQFARKVVGGSSTVYQLAVLDLDGRRVELSVRSAPLRSHDREIVGIFGLAVPSGVRETAEPPANEVRLTPRQAEVLRLLAEGHNTDAIAVRLGVALETARNHIRAVLKRLGVHSRLEAVVEARQRGMLDD